MTPRRKTVAVLATSFVLVLLLAAGGLAWFFFGGHEPDAVSLDAAVSSAPSTTTATASDDGGIAGVWTVQSGTSSFAGFRIAEELQSIGSTTAVGRTEDVDGTITVDGRTLTAASFTVDLTSITTNERRRDDKVQSALETDEHPTATFELTSPLDLGADAATGDDVEVTATGDLTIHGVTRSVQLPIEAKLVDGAIVLVGTTEVRFSDYGVDVPSSPVVLSVSDTGTVEVQLVLART